MILKESEIYREYLESNAKYKIGCNIKVMGKLATIVGYDFDCQSKCVKYVYSYLYKKNGILYPSKSKNYLILEPFTLTTNYHNGRKNKKPIKIHSSYYKGEVKIVE
jgi:hypothetical protein